MNRKTWAALVVAVVLFSSKGWAMGGVISGCLLPVEKEKSTWEKAATFANFLRGRVLASLVQDGMIEDDVAELLGPPIGTREVFADIVELTWFYDRLGIKVVFNNLDPCTLLPTSTHRVISVTFCPLFN